MGVLFLLSTCQKECPSYFPKHLWLIEEVEEEEDDDDDDDDIGI